MTQHTQASSPTAIVTGAARGIGLATARLFLAKGLQVAMVDRDSDELHRAASGLQGVLPVVCDVSQEQQVENMVSTVLHWSGRIDALVNNAGVADFGPIAQTSSGPVKTKLAQTVHSPDIVRAYHDAIPLNRYGSEDEIARVIVFLASEEASYLT
ncbi:MAG: SDR family oxidoreductase, partial [Betaproteobacteria bacterium]|nr:SDR family oxidoreductase [Betaproteobacteria bacterium]